MVNQPFYVSPEQLMADRADFARKGIARGRSVIVAQYDNGIIFVTENPSRALHKFSEIYDRIGFAAVGKYNEFENLRVAGIRYADMRGYTYDRSDVNARGLANAYAQTLGTAFTTDSKPLEVELVVAEVADKPSQDLLYRLTFDGSVAEEQDFVVMGGQASALNEAMKERWRPGLNLNEVLKLAIDVLAESPSRVSLGEVPESVTQSSNSAAGQETSNGAESTVEPVSSGASVHYSGFTGAQLEAAVLDRTRQRRKFRRLSSAAIDEILGEIK